MKYKACLLLAAAAISTPSVQCIPNFKSVLNFLKPYERYDYITDQHYHPIVGVNKLTREHVLKIRRGVEQIIDCKRYNQCKILSPEFIPQKPHFESINERLNNGGMANVFSTANSAPERQKEMYEKLLSGKKSLFCILTADDKTELTVLINREGECIDPSRPALEGTKKATLFMGQAEHQKAQYRKQVYEQGREYRWTRATIYNPGAATVGKYAAIVGTVWLGYKLCKKIFGKTKKPAPAKGVAKSKKAASRAVS